MNAWRKVLQLAMVLVVCALGVACPEPRNDAGGLGDEFEVALGFPRGLDAASRSTINDDGNVTKVYAKVYNSARAHLPAVDATSEISGVTKLTKNDGVWSATVKLAAPTSGTITFFVWAENASGEHLYSGDNDLVVGTNGNAITVPTAASYSIGNIGPAGGTVFYDKGSYSDGWRYLEIGPENLGKQVWSYVCGDGKVVGTTSSAIGTGQANTDAIIAQVGHSTSSAKVCSDYSYGGYSDWYLPSLGELAEIYAQKAVIPNLVSYAYWSSTEHDSYYAWYKDLGPGYVGYETYKDKPYYYAQPIRDF